MPLPLELLLLEKVVRILLHMKLDLELDAAVQQLLDSKFFFRDFACWCLDQDTRAALRLERRSVVLLPHAFLQLCDTSQDSLFSALALLNLIV